MEMFEVVPEMLRRLRMKQGKTQRQLASEAGLSKSHISKLENGQAPTLATLGKILRSQGLDLAGFTRFYREVEREHLPEGRGSRAASRVPRAATDFLNTLPPELEQGFFELARHVVVVMAKPGAGS